MTRFKSSASGMATLLIAGALAGCATAPATLPAPSLATNPKATDASSAVLTQQRYEARVAELVKKDPLFALLTAEIASQRGDTYSATVAYTEAARQQKNPDLARRAVEISLAEGQMELALKAAQAWAELAPTDKQATQTLMLLQLGNNQVDAALPALKAYLKEAGGAGNDKAAPAGFSAEKVAFELLMRIPDKAKAYSTAVELFGNNPADSEGQTLLAQIAHAGEQHDLAVAHMQNAVNKAPQERAYVLLAQFMEQRDGNPTAAMALIEQKITQNPKWFSARLYLARNHTQLQQWEKAKARFAEMIALQPGNFPLYSSQGFVLTQLKDYRGAEKHFRTYLTKTPAAERQNVVLIHATLADMAIELKNFPAAMKWLDSTPNAATELDIQLKKSALYEKQGNPVAAKQILTEFQPKNEDESVRLALARSQHAESQRAPAEAAQELESALKAYPDQPDLLYERAMVAERQKDLRAVEQYLQRLIKVRPENPHGYNALGYTWAENNMRLDEALALISKAVELAPNDPFILDSLGWVHFRRGDMKAAESTLRQAYTLRPDEEIGLHLIEVLMKAGKKAEARQLGTNLNERYPNSPKVEKLIQRIEGI